MTKKFKKQTKAQRRQWWDELDDNGKMKCVNYWLNKKAQKRKRRSIKTMEERELVDCQECIHGVTKSCTDDLPRGCEYFYKVA